MKKVALSIESPYATLNQLTDKTRHIWLACHGYGQLAKYFMRRFDVLNPEENYVIVPQGLSLFYLDQSYQKVGASWLTREHRQTGLHNMHAYLNAVFAAETQHVNWQRVSLSLFGFSQGTSAVVRWALVNKIPFRRLFFWAGTFPPEITHQDVEYLNTDQIEVSVFIGSEDEFFDAAVFESQVRRIRQFFPQLRVVPFEGGHEVSREVLAQAVQRPMLG